VAGLPGRHSGELAEDSGVAVLRTIAVTADHHRLEALGDELVEGRLVLGGREAMAGLPGGGAGRLAPDRSIEILGAIKVPTHPVEHVAFANKLVEGGLILRGSEAVTGDPGIGRPLMEDAGEAGAAGRGVAVHEHRVIALGSELI